MLARPRPPACAAAHDARRASHPPGPPRPGLRVANSQLADRILEFDADQGIVHAEAGLVLRDLNAVTIRRGWFVPVSPGTQDVTLGGMVAADVHGKNHHVAGCFGRHVVSLLVRTASGEIVDCSRQQQQDLFLATVGGMGLTGHILATRFQLQKIPSPWIWSESERVRNLEQLLARLQQASEKWPFTVAWCDSLARGPYQGRGILMMGRWAQPAEAPARAPRPRHRLRVPFHAPAMLMGPVPVRLFNSLYYRSHLRRRQAGIVHPESFFYPLDALRNWNHLYGRAGFTQYQCVLPRERGLQAVESLLERFRRLGGASFLTVVKDCGAQGDGLLSFPMPGTSVALDIPLRQNTAVLVRQLNELVIEQGGRVYLAKDLLTAPEQFHAMEPRLDAWLRVKRRWDPGDAISSAQAVRLRLLAGTPTP